MEKEIGLTKKAWQLYVLRLMLGAFEAGTYPGIVFYMVLFVPDYLHPRFLGIAFTGSMVGLALMGPLGAVLLSLHGVLSISGWRWMLFLEGFPACILGLVVVWYLPKNPAAAKFLNQEEKTLLEDELEESDERSLPGFWASLRVAIVNCQLSILIAAAFLFSVGRIAVLFWTPLWIESMMSGSALDLDPHKKDRADGKEATAALLSTIPYVCGALAQAAIGISSSYFRDRKIHVVILSILSGFSLCLLPIAASWGLAPGVLFLSITFAVCASHGGPVFSLMISVLDTNVTVLGLAWFNSLVTLSGVIGPSLVGFLASSTGSYVNSLYLSGALCFAGGLLVLFIVDRFQPARG